MAIDGCSVVGPLWPIPVGSTEAVVIGFTGCSIPMPVPTTGPTDIDSPTITNITPNPGLIAGSYNQASNTPISFDITDASTFSSIIVMVKLTHLSYTLVVHDGTEFKDPFVVNSSRVAITDGFTYTLLPSGGWQSDIESLQVVGIDDSGNKV